MGEEHGPIRRVVGAEGSHAIGLLIALMPAECVEIARVHVSQYHPGQCHTPFASTHASGAETPTRERPGSRQESCPDNGKGLTNDARA